VKRIANADSERFRSDAHKYAAYLQTPDGRLRLDLTFANLQGFLAGSQARNLVCALDVGGGTGAMAIRLAHLGVHVTLLDSSEEMLDLAKRAASEGGVSERIVLQQGDASQLMKLFRLSSFDVVVCHNILEYVDDPAAVLRDAARMLRDSEAILSVLVRNRAGEILKAAIQAGDLGLAQNNLDAEWAQESLYGGRVRLFARDSLQAMLQAASLEVLAIRGVRVMSDYLPSKVSRDAEYDRIFELERELGSRSEFAAVARYLQCLARRTSPRTEAGA
jgi:S-adenosylmethionine-dependent methyltransferase